MTRNNLYILFSICAVVWLMACSHQPDNLVDPGTGGTGGGGTGGGGTGGGPAIPCDPTKVYFQQQVLPILLSNCAMSGCHDDASHKEDVILTSYEKVMNTAEIRPGSPGESKLYKLITSTDPDKMMPPPPRAPLTAEQILVIRKWIEQGAQNQVCQSLCDSTQFTYSGAIRTIISNKCQGCHNGTGASGGIDLSAYTGVKARVLDGRLWGSINHLPGFSPMPKNGNKLSECEITQVRKWIDAGSPNN